MPDSPELSERYRIHIPKFTGAALLWGIWLGTILLIPDDGILGPYVNVLAFGALVWAGIKLFSSLAGYKVELKGDFLRFGYSPFIRVLHVHEILHIRKRYSTCLYLWRTSGCISLHLGRGKIVSVPCDDPELLSARLTVLRSLGMDDL